MSEVKETTTEDRQHEGRKAVFPMSRIKLTEPDDTGKRSFEGYASVFGNRDAHSDIVVKGAFARSLRERPELKVLWQHDTRTPIGIGSAYENEYGLVARGVLSNTEFVKGDVVPLLEDGVVSGLSIGYDVKVEEHDHDQGVWYLKDIDLYEFSPVTFPANELATVQVVKSLDNRGDRHAATVEQAAKSLLHEIEGYFGDSDRWAALDCKELKRLGALLRSKSAGAEATSADDAEFFYLTGLEDGLDLKEHATS